MSSQTVKVNRFSSGRAEVKVSKPGCAGCNSVYTTHSEVELQELLALIDGGTPDPVVKEDPPVVEEVTIEELESFVEAEIEAGNTKLDGDFSVVAFIDDSEEILHVEIINDTSEELAIYRFMTNFRSGTTKVKANDSVQKEYKIPGDAEEVWLRLGDESGEVLFHQAVHQEVLED